MNYSTQTQFNCALGFDPRRVSEVFPEALTATVSAAFLILHPTFSSKTLILGDTGLCWRVCGLGPFRLWRLAHWISRRRRTFWRKTNAQ